MVQILKNCTFLLILQRTVILFDYAIMRGVCHRMSKHCLLELSRAIYRTIIILVLLLLHRCC